MIENTFGINIIPENDAERLLALKRYRIMDTPSEESFDNIAKLATQIFNVPISLISLVDAEKVFFKANIGMGKAKEANRGKSLCALAVLDTHVTVFEDALKEPCLIANPNVAGDFGLRFYAGAPLTTNDGFLIGTLCIIDKQPRTFSKIEEKILQGLATAIMDQVELRLSALEEIDKQQLVNNELIEHREETHAINEELTATNEELRNSQEELQKTINDLSESENRFRSLVSQAPVAITIYSGPDLIIEQANEYMMKLLGRTDNIIGLPLLQARPELLDHPYIDIIHSVVSSGEIHIGTGIKAPVRTNGEVKEGYFDVTYKPLKDDNGVVTGVMVVATDVTEKTMSRLRETEMNEELAAMNEELMASNEELNASQHHLQEINNSLGESESRFRAIVEQSPVAIATLKGRELVVDLVNEMILKIWGKDQAVVGKALHIALPELEGQPFLKLLDEVFTSGQPFYGNEASVALVHKGVLADLYVNFVYQPIIGEDGKTKDIMVVAIDVTEQVNARKTIEETEKRLRLITDNISQLAWMADETGSIFWYNQRWYDYTGTDLEQMQGWGWQTVHHPDHVERVVEKIGRHFISGEIWEDTFPLKGTDGEYRWFLSRAVPTRNEQGEILSWFGTNTDITEQHNLEKRKDDFLSIASHELKTPITSLKASLQLLNLIKEKPTSPLHVKLIDQSNRSMDKMSLLVDELLNVNRLTEGQLALNKTTFTIAEMLNGCCSHIRAAGKHNLVLQGDESLQIYADEHRIDQVVVNFVNNAVKYAPDSKEIFMIVEKLDGYAKIAVRDTGPGIAAEKLPYIFDRYYRADNSDKTYNGLGLGLYICAEIIKRHGGEIGVESELGKGSAFWFTLPL
jgi:PAS domain S-box-containing protein